jgi:biopolymer transport protein ExbD
MNFTELLEGSAPKLPGAHRGVKIMTPQQFVSKSDDSSSEEVAEEAEQFFVLYVNGVAKTKYTTAKKAYETAIYLQTKMPKVKIPRKSTVVDMTAMCDVAFLLLTFFMLATKFKPDEPVVVKTPSSISDIPQPDANVMLITVDENGRLFFSIDNQSKREEMINSINASRGLDLTPDEITKFKYGSSVGVPFNELKSYLAATPGQQKQMDKTVAGIPLDSSSANTANEFAVWVNEARYVNPNLRIFIKADSKTAYPVIKNILSTFAGLSIYRFNLLTDLEAIPQGTAAYEASTAKK